MTQLILNHHTSVRGVKRDRTPSVIVAENFKGLGFDTWSLINCKMKTVYFNDISQKGVLFIKVEILKFEEH